MTAARNPVVGAVPAGPDNRWSHGSLTAALGGHDNALGIIRLVLASLVIFSHAFPVGGWGDDPAKALTAGQETIGGFAVVGFFAVSGYLITKSGRSNDVLQFLWRRALRIFPAYWFVLVVSAFVIGPLVWLAEGRGLRGYLGFGGGGPVSYVVANADLTIRQYGIYDLFATTTPYGERTGASVINGSIWTLTYEWTCYLGIALLILLGVLRFARWVIPVIAVALLVAAAIDATTAAGVDSLVPVLADDFRVTLGLAFLCGSVLAVYSRGIPCDDRLGALAAVIVVASLAFGGWVIIGYPALAYLLLWAAARLPARVRWIGQRNDYSYGMYVFGWPVQQVTAYLGWNEWGYVPWVAVTLVITACFAWMSWHLVEKRALALKDLGPGRGIRELSQRVRALVQRRRRPADQ